MQSVQYEYPPHITTLPIHGSSTLLPVRRIYCVGRNYIDHIREMKEADEREPPFFFQKPTDSIVQDGARVPYPPDTCDFQFEVELVVAISRRGRDIDPTIFWVTRLASSSLGAIANARCVRKCCHGSAESPSTTRLLVERWHRAGNIGHPSSGAITLAVNGVMKQNGDIPQMI
jgi:fumarylpyruvate hydrolase